MRFITRPSIDFLAGVFIGWAIWGSPLAAPNRLRPEDKVPAPTHLAQAIEYEMDNAITIPVTAFITPEMQVRANCFPGSYDDLQCKMACDELSAQGGACVTEKQLMAGGE